MTTIHLDVHGIAVVVDLPSDSQVGLLRRDYGPFEARTTTGEPRLRVTASPDTVTPMSGEVCVDGILGDTIHLGDRHIIVSGASAASDEAYFREIRSYLTAAVISAVQLDLAGLDLHSSCVRPPGGGAVLLTGAKKAGKSSMALAMVDHGWEYLANEMTMLWREEENVVVATLPQAVAIAPAAQSWFAKYGSRVLVPTPHALPDSGDHEALYAFEEGEKTRVERDAIRMPGDFSGPFRDRLQAIILVEPAMQLEAPRLRRLEPGDAAVRLMENVEYYLRWGRGPALPAERLLAQTSALALDAAAAAPAFHLQWCPDHRLNARAVAAAVEGSRSA